MLKIILIAAAAIFFPLLFVGIYAMFLICATAPVSAISIEKAGQFGDSFGVITCLFSGFAFSGVLVSLYLQREESKRSEQAHVKNTRLTALAALLSVYDELENTKQKEIEKQLATSIPGGTGGIEAKLQDELSDIQRTRESIYRELENAAGI